MSSGIYDSFRQYLQHAYLLNGVGSTNLTKHLVALNHRSHSLNSQERRVHIRALNIRVQNDQTDENDQLIAQYFDMKNCPMK